MINNNFWSRIADVWVKKDDTVIPDIELTDSADDVEAFLNDNDLDMLSELDDILGDLSLGD